MKKVLIVTLGLCCHLAVAAAEHPVDQRSRRAMAQAVTTADMVAANLIAQHGWQQLLGTVQKSLQELMQPATYRVLLATQAQWSEYRDAEFQLIDRIYQGDLQGTLWRPAAVSAKTRLVRQRVQLLLAYHDALVDQPGTNREAMIGRWQSLSDARQSVVIRDDLTMLWGAANGSDVVFYYLARTCGALPPPADHTALVTQAMGFAGDPDCYFFAVDRAGKLQLQKPDGTPVGVYTRIR